MRPELVDTDAYTYALIDYRGYGARKDEAGEYTLEEISADTLVLADELGWGRFTPIPHPAKRRRIKTVLQEVT